MPILPIYFGTNQVLEYNNANEVLDCIEITDITDKQAEDIQYFFGDTYGFFPGKYLSEFLHDLIIEREMR